MSDITKPVILDETGKQLQPKIEALTEQIQGTVEPFENAVDNIIAAMDRLDIIWYVEN